MPSTVVARRLALVAIYVLLLIGGGYFGSFLMQLSDIDIRPINEPAVHMMIMVTTAVFVVASALPFVPGAEIGFGLILVFGGQIALLVYLAMVAALTSSYLIGRMVPPRSTAAFFRFCGMLKAGDLVKRMDKLKPAQKLDVLMQHAPRRFVPFLLRHRYLALIILINVPGNSLIGGGGGIAFSAGLSGLFSFPRYMATIALATLPVPAFFYFSA